MSKYLQTYKQKTIAVGIGSLLFLIIAYQLAFKKTFTEINKYSTTQDKLANVDVLKKQVTEYQSLLASFNDNKPTNLPLSQGNLYELISKFCDENGLIIEQMPEVKVYDNQAFLIEQHNFIFKGEYREMLRLLYAIEQEWRIAKVVSSRFYLEKNRENRQEELKAEFHLQNIKNNAS